MVAFYNLGNSVLKKAQYMGVERTFVIALCFILGKGNYF